MGRAIAVRTDYTPGEVRRLAKRAKDGVMAGVQEADGVSVCAWQLPFAGNRMSAAPLSPRRPSGHVPVPGADPSANHGFDEE